MIDFSKLEKIAEYRNGELQWLEGRDINAIYVILIEDEYYIGSSHYTYLRIGQHVGNLEQGNHHSKKLQEKFNKFGWFDVYSLDRGIEKHKLQTAEYQYIEKYSPTLNIKTLKKNKGLHRIKELIKEKGYTQEEFAELLGMSRNGLYQIINGIPSGQSLIKIAEALNVELWELFAEGRDIASRYQPNEGDAVRCPNCKMKLNASFEGARLTLNTSED